MIDVYNRLQKKLDALESSISDYKDEFNKKEMLLNLENKLILSKNIVKNYPGELKQAEKKLDELRALSGGSVGYVPAEKELDDATQKILALSERAALAEAGIAVLTPQIEELRAELQPLEAQRLKDNPESVIKSEFTEVNGLRFDSIEEFVKYHKERA